MAKENPVDLKYTKEHEWLKIEGDIGICGITDHAQELLTDVVFIELPEVDDEITIGDKLATLESVKSVSDVYAPVSGVIIEVNTITQDNPGIVNTDAYGDGWLFKIKLSDPAQLDALMSADQYNKFVTE